MKYKMLFVVFAVFFVFTFSACLKNQNQSTPETNPLSPGCLASGGQIAESLCCLSSADFPNTCLLGACGCSPENSHQVKICLCPTDQCFNGEKCVVSQDLVSPDQQSDLVGDLFTDIQTQTKLDFSEPRSGHFIWRLRQNKETMEVPIDGLSFGVENIKSLDYINIEKFFQDANFEVDVYNMAAGTLNGMTGYKQGQLACLVEYNIAQENVANQSGLRDVIIKCGQADESLQPVISQQEIIQQLFADKYNKKLSAITLTIQQQTDTHVRGLVRFEDEAGPGNAGIFLVAWVNGTWQLLFDGNGLFSCQEMQTHGFPSSMLEGCF